MYKTLEEQKQAITKLLLNPDSNLYDAIALDIKLALEPMHISLVYHTRSLLPDDQAFDELKIMLRAICLNHIALLTRDQILVNVMPKAAYVVIKYAYSFLDQKSQELYNNILTQLTDPSYDEFKAYFLEQKPMPTHIALDTLKQALPTFSEGEE